MPRNSKRNRNAKRKRRQKAAAATIIVNNSRRAPPRASYNARRGREIIGRRAVRSGFNINPRTAAFLDAVVNPVDCRDVVCVPDGLPKKRITLTDYSWNVQPNLIWNNALVPTVNGCFIYMIPTTNKLLTTYSSQPGRIFNIVIAATDSTGKIITNAAGELPILTQDNYSSIFGTTTTPDVNTSLITDVRWIAGGMRIHPVIEMVTDSTTAAVSNYYGCCVTPNDIFAAMQANTTILPIIKNNQYMQTYANSEGVTVRLDPFQYESWLRMRDFDSWESDAWDWGSLYFPAIYVQFMEGLTGGNTPVPFYFSSQWWFEGLLKQPSPLYDALCPPDMEWYKIRLLMSASYEHFPMVVAGHTFKKFQSSMLSFAKLLTSVGSVASHVSVGNYSGAIMEAGSYLNRKNKRRLNYAMGMYNRFKSAGANPPNY